MRRAILVLLALNIVSAAEPDAREIILRSTARDQRDIELTKNYTYVTVNETREFDSKGNVTSTKGETHDVTILYGRPYSRLTARDGKPLSASDANKEQQKMDKEIERRRKESEKDRAKLAAEEAKRIEEQKQMLREVADAFTFRIAGEEDVDGHRTWVIHAAPRPGYRPQSRRASVLPKVRARLWVTQDEYRWVKVDAEVIDTLSVGLFLVRIQPGTRLVFEQRRVQEEIWLPSQARVYGNARVALFKKFNGEMVVRWENYRKFQSDTRLLEAEPATSSSQPRE